MPIQKRSLATLSNDALCRLRDEIADILNGRAEELRREIKRLTGERQLHTRSVNGKEKDRPSKRDKFSAKFRNPDGKTWCGRGARPQWLVDELKNGKSLDDFLIVNDSKDVANSPHSNGSAKN